MPIASLALTVESPDAIRESNCRVLRLIVSLPMPGEPSLKYWAPVFGRGPC